MRTRSGEDGPGWSLRELGAGEAGLIVGLHEGLQRLHAEHRPDVFHAGATVAERETHLAGMLARPGWFALLATEAELPAGYILAEVQRVAADAVQCARVRGMVHHVAVRNDARRQGIGAALMAAVRARFVAEGASIWAASYWSWNAASAGLMAKCGLMPAIVLADAPL